MNEEPYVGIKDVAKHFAVSVTTVRAWIRDNLIPAPKMGGQYRFKLSAVEAALTQQQAVRETATTKTKRNKR